MDQNLDKITTMSTTYLETEEVQELGYEDYQKTNLIETASVCSVHTSWCDGDDEVFVDFEKSVETAAVIKREPRVRRISDVIDSVGDIEVGSEKKQSFLEFNENSWTMEHGIREGLIYSDIKEVSTQRILTEMAGKEKLQSPPPTPCSDLGYESTSGLSSPPSQMNFKPKWFRYSTSSIEPPSSPSKCDTTDARVMTGYSSSVRVQQALMPVRRESVEYNMNHPKRGYAVIFNHEEFSSGCMPVRKGSHVDVDSLKKVYSMLGFEVKVYNNLKCEKLREVIRELAERDHSDCDCLLVTVLTHGLKNNYLFAEDYAYPTESLWAPFTGDRCKSLAGKPKIFIIQACRGEALDGGVRLVSTTQTDSGSTSYKIPTMADFLIAFSTAEGFYSWRNPENGTWFIQSLCEVLSDCYLSLDFLKIMTRVSQKVAVDYESFNDVFMDKHEQKQVPNMHTTLIRDIYFRPKFQQM